ncbi:hypothetical protein BD779DRAFT_1471065 [Infundibulicybe gibba]|nr:hypothetical protein BD779DRAFT_1471065 [Infundibulicybe gibba]
MSSPIGVIENVFETSKKQGHTIMMEIPDFRKSEADSRIQIDSTIRPAFRSEQVKTQERGSQAQSPKLQAPTLKTQVRSLAPHSLTNASPRRGWNQRKQNYSNIQGSRATGVQTARADLLGTYNIKAIHQHSFSGYFNLAKLIKSAMSEKGGPEYIAVTNFSPKDLEYVVSVRLDFPPARITYSGEAETIVIKTVPGLAHEIGVNKISDLIKEYLSSKGVAWETLCTTGGARFLTTSTVKPLKEPDQSYKPMATRPEVNAFPSFVIEVGVSQTLASLRCDAHKWLSKTGMATKLVLLVSINMTARKITLERWEMVRTTRPPRTAQYRCKCRQMLVLYADGMVIGAPLLLPARLIYDNLLPLGLNAADFTFSEDILVRCSSHGLENLIIYFYNPYNLFPATKTMSEAWGGEYGEAWDNYTIERLLRPPYRNIDIAVRQQADEVFTLALRLAKCSERNAASDFRKSGISIIICRQHVSIMPPPAPVDVDPFELDDPNDEDPAYDSDVDYDSMDLLTLYRIPQRCRHAFRTFDGLRAFMEESTRAFGGGWGPGRQLVGVTGFSAEHLAQFDEIRDTLPPVRVTYEGEDQMVVFKLIG